MAELIGERPGNYRHPSTPVKGEPAGTSSPVRFQNLPPRDLLFVRAGECLTPARQTRDSRGFVIASWSPVHHLLEGGDIIRGKKGG
jgi:hypothetical protein